MHRKARRSGRLLGGEFFGELGDGSATDVVQVAAGLDHTCAVRAPEDGPRHVICWGLNRFYQLGATEPAESRAPLRVPDTEGAVEVTVGWDFACARLDGGEVRCWGSNRHGELGRGSTIPERSEMPMPVPLAAGAVDVEAGGRFACAVLETGAVQCWGDNSGGQLGDGTREIRATPVFAGTLADVVEVVAGARHTCARARAEAGAVVTCWGSDSYGQLGDGEGSAERASMWMGRSSPGPPIEGLSAVEIGAGSGTSCAVPTRGPPRCWGSNSSGEVGNGDTADVHSPVDVLGLP